MIWWIIIGLLLVVGFLGCFINKFPGPVAVLLALILAIVGPELKIGWGAVAVVALLVAASFYITKKIPELVKSFQGYSKKASTGTTIGSIAALVVIGCLVKSLGGSPVVFAIVSLLMLIGIPFVCAYVFELSNKKEGLNPVKSATAATVVYAANTLVKLVIFVYAIYAIFKV